MGQNPIMATAQEKMEFRENLLDEYEKSIHVPSNLPPGMETELQQYLSMDKVAIESLDRESSLAISIRLAQYAIFVRRCVNKEKGRIRWANDEITKMSAKQYNQFDPYIRYEVRLAMICGQDTAAQELQSIITYAQQRVDRLDELASDIKNLGYIFSLLYKNKGDYRQ